MAREAQDAPGGDTAASRGAHRKGIGRRRRAGARVTVLYAPCVSDAPSSTARALVPFVLSRAAIWIVAVTTLVVADDHVNPGYREWDSARLHDLGRGLDVWARWDSDWFLRIAESWYDWPSSTPAFFPLYPLALAGVGRALGGHYVLGGVVVSAIAGGAAFVLLHRLTERLRGMAVADRTIILLAVFPTSLFLTAVYSESLFLALAVGTFVLAERGRLGWAALVAGLALLTRSQGLALLPALALFAWDGERRLRRLWVVLVPLGVFAAYPAALAVSIGRPWAFLGAQETVWGRRFDPFGPVVGPVTAVADGHVVEVAAFALMIPLAIVAWRELGASYGAYALGALVLPTFFPSARFGALYSIPRLALVAFPCFIALAILCSRRALWVTTVTLSSLGLVVLVIRWALWEWVA